MSYDDWKTTDPAAGEHCENGHYHCQSRCPVCKGCVDSCDHDREDVGPAPPPSDQDVRAALVRIILDTTGRDDICDRHGIVYAIMEDPLLGKLLRGGR